MENVHIVESINMKLCDYWSQFTLVEESIVLEHLNGLKFSRATSGYFLPKNLYRDKDLSHLRIKTSITIDISGSTPLLSTCKFDAIRSCKVKYEGKIQTRVMLLLEMSGSKVF